MIFLRAQTLENANDDEVTAAQVAQNLAAFRGALIDDLIKDVANVVEESDRALLTTGLEMTRTEFDLLLTLTRVYDHTRSHFVVEICEPPTKRFLNALRIRHEEGGDRMPWALYKSSLLERMQNLSTILVDGLISLILKLRDNGCPIDLWVAERIAERRHLLNEDEIKMSEDTWLELLLAFVTNETRERDAAGSGSRPTSRVRRTSCCVAASSGVCAPGPHMPLGVLPDSWWMPTEIKFLQP
jgi:hypothetical protein